MDVVNFLCFILAADHPRPDLTNYLDHNKEMKDNIDNMYNTPNHHMGPPMKTFYNKNTVPVAPYATTTLINSLQSTNNMLNKEPTESAFRPIQSGYIHQGSGSSDSCLKPDLSSDSNTDNSRCNAEMPQDHHALLDMASPVSDSGSITTGTYSKPCHVGIYHYRYIL